MRLIDADALIEDIKTRLWDWDSVDGITSSTVLKQTIADIENQPTVELLKAQEPRVLTLEEVMALPNGEETDVAVVKETKIPVGTWDMGSICQWRGAKFVQETAEDNDWYYTKEAYGKIWRCWTAMPTIKQRKAVKWDD